MRIRPVFAGLSALFGATLALSAPALSQTDSTAAEGLGPTTAAPWNPAKPEPAMEPWEAVLRAPGRIVTLPISALGWLTRNSMLKAEEHSVVPKTVAALSAPSLLGLYIMPAALGDRTGFGGTLVYSPPAARRLATAAVSLSTGGYSRIEAGIGPPIARFDYLNDWRPHDRLFGIGIDTDDDDITSYSNSLELYRLSSHLGFGAPRESKRQPYTLELGASRRHMKLGEPQGDPDIDDNHPFDPATSPVFDAFGRKWKGQILSGSLQADHRNGIPHWSRGFRVLGGMDYYDPDAEEGGGPPVGPLNFATFQRYSAELEGGVSFYRDPRTLRLFLRAMDIEIGDQRGGRLVPVPDLAELGGRKGLQGYEPGRFHDLDALIGKLSYIFPLAQHYEMDLHVESGGVYRDLWNDANIPGLKTSYGVAFRARTNFAPVAVIGVDWSTEGARISYSLGGVE